MPTRITGLTSGLDTEQLVSAMVMNYKAKADKGVQAQKSLQYKLDALKSANKQVYSLFSAADKMRWSSAYSLKSTTVSDATKAKVTASDTAVNGTQTLEIKQLAQAGYLTGGNVKSDGALSTSTKLSDIYATDKDGKKQSFGGGTISVTVGGKEKTLTLTDKMTAGELVGKLKDMGLNASFDEKNARFFISSKNSGEGNDFKLVANDGNAMQSLKALGLYTTDDDTKAEYQKWADLGTMLYDPDDPNPDPDKVAAWNTYLDEQYASKVITVENRAESYATKYNNATKSLEHNQKEAAKLFEKVDTDTETYKDAEAINKKTEELRTQRDTDTKYDAYRTPETDEDGNVTGYKYDTAKMKADAADASVTTFTADDLKAFDSLQADIKKFEDVGKDMEMLEGYINDANKIIEDVKDKVILETGDDGKVTAKAVTADNDPNNVYSSLVKEVADDNESARDALGKQLRTRIEQSIDILDDMKNADQSQGAVRIKGQDSKIMLNGAEFTSDKNSFSINGLSIEATGLTEKDSPITITTSTDTQGLYDKIKDFLSQYNDVVNYLSKMYNADSAKGYDPLTDEQKAEMSETEINLWETKIKDSILRRDSTIGGINTALSQAMAQVFNVNGKSLSLSSFGIKTAGYFAAEKNEKYAYHIDGDADDSTSSGNQDKLMAAIVADPESVANFFQKLSSSVYDVLNDKMRRSSLSSAYTIYNDKEMASEYSDYTKTISKWQDQVTSMEDYYFKKFSQMESTLTKLQSQTGQLSSYFGG